MTSIAEDTPLLKSGCAEMGMHKRGSLWAYKI